MNRNDFEAQAYQGYVSRGIGDTDGWYHPESKESFVDSLRLQVPVSPESFARHNDTEFRPTQQQCDEYNASFLARPTALRIAIRTDKGWKTIEGIKGTKDAHGLLAWVATEFGFEEARLENYRQLESGHWVPQIVKIQGFYVQGNKAVTNRKLIRRGDFLGTYAKLLKPSASLEIVLEG